MTDTTSYGVSSILGMEMSNFLWAVPCAFPQDVP